MKKILIITLTLMGASTSLFSNASRDSEPAVLDIAIESGSDAFVARLQFQASAFFEDFTGSFVRNALAQEEGVVPVEGGPSGRSGDFGVHMSNLSVRIESEMSGYELRDVALSRLATALEESGATKIGQAKGTPPNYFTIFYVTEQRFGSISCTLVPSASDFLLMVFIQESPQLEFTLKQAAEQISDGNTEKPPGVERTQ